MSQLDFYPPENPSKEELVLTQLINQDPWRQTLLLALQSVCQTAPLSAPLYAAAGFLRNLYWDHAHNLASTLLNDVDIAFFDPQSTDKSQDILLERLLNELQPTVPWSVKNQARMHMKSRHSPYLSLENALYNWVETATAIGVRVDEHQRLDFIAPWGFADLFNLWLRPTAYFFQHLDIFHQRIAQKQWLIKWPKLQVVLTPLS